MIQPCLTNICLEMLLRSHSPNDVPPNLSGTYPEPRFGAPCVRPILCLDMYECVNVEIHFLDDDIKQTVIIRFMVQKYGFK